MAIFNEETTMMALDEMKSKEKYRKESFKKKYKYESDGKDKYGRTGTITDPKTGEKHPVEFTHNTGLTNGFMAAQLDGSGKINMDDRTFTKLKGSHKNERRDAIMQHEIGHTKLHGLGMANATPKVFSNLMLDNLRDRHGINLKSDSKISKRMQNYVKGAVQSAYAEPIDPYKPDFSSTKGVRKFIGKDGGGRDIAKMLKDSNVPKDYIKNRDAAYQDAKKYEINDVNHSSGSEYEADRYAGNKTSDRAIKKGVANAYKVSKKQFPESNNKVVNSMRQIDMVQRTKALKDKKISKNPLYK